MAKRAKMEDLYMLNLNGMSKKGRTYLGKSRAKRAKINQAKIEGAKMEEPLSIEVELKKLKWKDLCEPNLARRANMEDLYQLNLNGKIKNENLSVKVN